MFPLTNIIQIPTRFVKIIFILICTIEIHSLFRRLLIFCVVILFYFVFLMKYSFQMEIK